MQQLFSLRNIQKTQGAFTLEVDHLDLFSGNLYTLTGPNGAGKSTLLNILAFLSRPDCGELVFAGEPARWTAAGLRQCRRQVTMVQQNPFLFDATVFQNIAFGLKIRGVIGRKQRQRIYTALDALGLAGFEDRRARGLSGGEAQKVAIARALVLNPRALLLDEPTSNIDAGQIESLEQLIPTLTDQGMTVIMVTHDQAQPRRMGSTIIPMAGGRLRNR